MPCVSEMPEDWEGIEGVGKTEELRSLLLSNLHFGMVEGKGSVERL